MAESVAVLGAGIVGLSCALTLSELDYRVSIYDPRPGAGTSEVAGGMLAVVGEARIGEGEAFSFNNRGAALWPSFLEKLSAYDGISAAELIVATETVLVGFDAADAQDVQRIIDWAKTQGAHSESLDSEVQAELVPQLSSRMRPGYLVSDEWALDNKAVIAALISALQQRGITFYPNRINDVSELDVDIVVVATGPSAPELLPQLPISLGKGEILRLAAHPGVPGPPKQVIRSLVAGRSLYIVPRADGVVIGATHYEYETDNLPQVGGVSDLLVDALTVIPALRDYRCVAIESGFRPMSPDGLPLIGWYRDNIFVATGHGRNGFLLAPLTARLIAQSIAQQGDTDRIVNPQRFHLSDFVH